MAMTGVSKFFAKLTEPAWLWAVTRYQASVAKSLKKYGLRYDDLYDDLYDLDVKEALKRLPREETDARNQRLKRAIDLSMKHYYLSKELQEKQTPYAFYLQKQLAEIKDERDERAEIGSDMPYNRQIP
eukprot:TRINITY_DN12360_c0_g1_i1.p1 TRINITY_DN12360_c0_g1~~TRINITY_DN12360_c0_g1_i1.p1  ORF type:complete len:128 (-),score=30.68 TRINITY_DN12360_c0_g1_i1:183-566(-)